MAEAQDVQPAPEASAAEETPQQLRDRLADLTVRAAAKDAIKDYNTAAELYSQATELQALLNGEMSADNADLLFAYGNALYNVAVAKSDVLGAKVAGEPGADGQKSTPAAEPSAGSSVIGDAIARGVAEKGEGQEKSKGNQPFFQFTGDENFDDSDDEEEAEGPAEEEEDDFQNAFEVLDLARVLLLRKLQEMEENTSGKGKGTSIAPEVRSIKERLADTYDLQSEISLEAERFPDAVVDLRAALELKQELFPKEDSAVAECHYKLSLALEFSSVTRQTDDEGNEVEGQIASVDEAMREEAASHMEAAIESCKLRIGHEEKKLESGEISEEDKVTAAKRNIANVKEIVTDMEQRLVELRRPPVSINESNASVENALGGILGQILGQSPADQKAKLDAAAQNATDLSGLVRKRKPESKPQTPPTTQSSSNGNGKRPAEAADSTDDPNAGKKAKVEDDPSDQ